MVFFIVVAMMHLTNVRGVNSKQKLVLWYNSVRQHVVRLHACRRRANEGGWELLVLFSQRVDKTSLCFGF